MALVQLSNVVVPEVFNAYFTRDTMERSRIFQSGILRPDPMLNSFLAGGGLTVNVPFWKDLDNTEPGIANDDPTSVATPGNISTGQETAIRNIRTRGWSSADLVSELAGSDPMARIRERVAAYWTRAFERHLISLIIGVMADNAANDGGDMRLVIGEDAVGDPADADKISAEALIDAKQTMGDAAEGLGVLIVHSVVHSRMQKLNLIDFIPDSRGEVQFESYMGYRLVVSDQVRVVQGTTNTDRYLYSSYMFAPGTIAWGESPVDRPSEVERRPDQGNGMGVEVLWTRRQYIMHPYGFDWTDSSRAGQFPTNAENQAAANWNRVVAERKQIGLVEIVTNG
jgi:hypothetical protein